MYFPSVLIKSLLLFYLFFYFLVNIVISTRFAYNVSSFTDTFYLSKLAVLLADIDICLFHGAVFIYVDVRAFIVRVQTACRNCKNVLGGFEMYRNICVKTDDKGFI